MDSGLQLVIPPGWKLDPDTVAVVRANAAAGETVPKDTAQQTGDAPCTVMHMHSIQGPVFLPDSMRCLHHPSSVVGSIPTAMSHPMCSRLQGMRADDRGAGNFAEARRSQSGVMHACVRNRGDAQVAEEAP